jgi:hypothetical protein
MKNLRHVLRVDAVDSEYVSLLQDFSECYVIYVIKRNTWIRVHWVGAIEVLEVLSTELGALHNQDRLLEVDGLII